MKVVVGILLGSTLQWDDRAAPHRRSAVELLVVVVYSSPIRKGEPMGASLSILIPATKPSMKRSIWESEKSPRSSEGYSASSRASQPRLHGKDKTCCARHMNTMLPY